jgi:hypothetical protein
VAQVRLVFQPILNETYHDLNTLSPSHQFLVYAQPFKLTAQPSSIQPGGPRGMNRNAITGLYGLQRVMRSNDTRLGGILPLRLLVMPVDVTPRFGSTADRRLTAQNCMESVREFWLNKYWDKEYYHLL